MTVYGAYPRAAYRQLPKRAPRSLGFERHALRFDGLSHYLDCGAGVSLDIVNEITVEALFMHTTLLGDNRRIQTKGFSYMLRSLSTGATQFQVWVGGAQKNSGIATLVINTLYHAFGVYKNTGPNVLLYVNNVLYVGDAIVGNIDVSANNLNIGRRVTAADDWFCGLVYLFRLYNLALTAEQVRWNMVNYHHPVRPDRLVAYLPMEEGAGLTANDVTGNGNNGALRPALAPPTWENVKKWEIRSQTE